MTASLLSRRYRIVRSIVRWTVGLTALALFFVILGWAGAMDMANL